MTNFKLHDLESAPKNSTTYLESLANTMGFIPNVFATVAESPIALKGLVELNGAFGSSSFTPEEQQIILLATSTENECVYCVAGHTAFGKSIGMDEQVLNDMRSKEQTTNPLYNTLANTVRELIQTGGRVSTEQLKSFLGDGYTQEQFLELILGVCVKTFTNYASNSLTIPLDDAFKDYAWDRPSEIKIKQAS